MPACYPDLVYWGVVQGRNDMLMGALRKWVQDEYKDKRGQEVDTSSWPIRCGGVHILLGLSTQAAVCIFHLGATCWAAVQQA